MNFMLPLFTMIDAGMKITYFDVGEKMYGLGTPEDLSEFLKTELSKTVFV